MHLLLELRVWLQRICKFYHCKIYQELDTLYFFFLKFLRAKINKGVGVENCHYLNDGLWQMKPIK